MAKKKSSKKKSNWGKNPNKMAAALYYNRKNHRNNRTPIE